MSMYSLCSFHWNHIRKPSSKNVAIKQNLAIVGRTCFPFLITYHNEQKNTKIFLIALICQNVSEKKVKVYHMVRSVNSTSGITTTTTTERRLSSIHVYVNLELLTKHTELVDPYSLMIVN